MSLTLKNIEKIIDHTNISRKATEKDIKKTCREAIRYNFRGVCVNPEWVKLAADELEGAETKVIALIDSPMGLSPHLKRVEIAKKAKKDGADELDVVLNVIDVKYERYDEVLNDLKEICKILPTKVIICSGYLTDEEIKKASSIAKEAGAFCIKTSTEKDPIENIDLKEKARHLGIIKESAPGLKVKASGKIRTLRDFKMMVEAGADIIGTSSGVEIIKSYKRARKGKRKFS
jgi:deoxyribose-phosphate aldolase